MSDLLGVGLSKHDGLFVRADGCPERCRCSGVADPLSHADERTDELSRMLGPLSRMLGVWMEGHFYSYAVNSPSRSRLEIGERVLKDPSIFFWLIFSFSPRAFQGQVFLNSTRVFTSHLLPSRTSSQLQHR